MRSNLFPIAKEGWNYLAYAIALFATFSLLDLEFLRFLTFLAILVFLFIFRNPERETMLYQEQSVVSPVDGKVVSIEDFDGKDGYGYVVEIESSPFDVALLRAPFSSEIESVEIYHGARLPLASSLAKKLNENARIVFRDVKSKNFIKIEHCLKQSIKGIDITLIKAQKVLQGLRYGFMLNGRTRLYLPHNFRLNAAVGNELRASESLIGYFTLESQNQK